jgi:hypothetical protein
MNVVKLKYLGMIETNYIYIRKEIKNRLKVDGASYHSNQNLFVFPSAT